MQLFNPLFVLFYEVTGVEGRDKFEGFESPGIPTLSSCQWSLANHSSQPLSWSGALPSPTRMRLAVLTTHFILHRICGTLGPCYLRSTLRRTPRGEVYPPSRGRRWVLASACRGAACGCWGVVQSVGHLTVNE